MNLPRYPIDEPQEIFSPGLVIIDELLRENLRQMIRIAGGPDRLRPHCKTHKMPAITRLELELGITRHKCATLAEAEMLAGAGVKDILLAYNPVGPNLERVTSFLQRYPDVTLLVTADHAEPIEQLGQHTARLDRTIGVLLDIDTGMHRTGIPAGPQAVELYKQIAETPGVQPAGLHVYDGHQHQQNIQQRTAAVQAGWEPVAELRQQLLQRGWPVPRIVAGGTGSFPIYARMDDPAVQMSPGTTVLYDVGYRQMFPELPFVPAAVLLTRVISLPGCDRLTCDLGYKACASDPPAGERLFFPDLPEAREVLQNEEHLVLETPRAGQFHPGDVLVAIPRHICPTVALHDEVYVVREGKLIDRWQVVARKRRLSI